MAGGGAGGGGRAAASLGRRGPLGPCGEGWRAGARGVSCGRGSLGTAPWRLRRRGLAGRCGPARRPVRLPLSSGKAARPFRAAPDEGRAWRALGPGRFRPVRGQPLARRDLVAAAGGLWARAAQPHFSPFHPSQASVPDNPLAPLPPSQRRRNGRANPWAREPRRQAEGSRRAGGPEDGFPNNEALVGVSAMAEKKGEEQETFKPPAGHLR